MVKKSAYGLIVFFLLVSLLLGFTAALSSCAGAPPSASSGEMPASTQDQTAAVPASEAATAVPEIVPDKTIKLPDLAKLKILSDGGDVSHRIEDLVYFKGAVYAATPAGLDVYSIKEKDAIVLKETVLYPLPHGAQRWMGADGNLIAIPAGWNGVFLYSLEEGDESPKFAATVPSDMDASSALIAGNTLYIGGGRDDKMFLLIYDIGDPAAAKPLARLQVSSRGAWRSALRERNGFVYYYVADGDQSRCRLVTIDARKPAAPVVSDTIANSYGDNIRMMAIGADTLFMGAYNPYRIESYDLSDPAKPRKIGETRFHTDPWRAPEDLEYADGRLLALGSQAFQVYDIGKDRQLVRVYSGDTVKQNSNYYILAAGGGEAFIADVPSRIKRVSLTASSAPSYAIQSAEAMDNNYSVEAYGDKLYVAAGQNLLDIYDLADPAKPTLRERVQAEYPASSKLRIDDGFLFLPYVHFGLYVLDLADGFDAKVNISSLGLNGGLKTWQLDIRDRHAAVCNYDGMMVILDMAVPGSPSVVKAIKSPTETEDLLLDPRGGYLYAFDIDQTIRVYGLGASDILAPVASLKLPERAANARNVIVDTTLYLCCHGSGLVQIDIADPRNPKIVQSFRDFPNGTQVRAVQIYGDYALIANGWNGLVILRLSTGMYRKIELPGFIQDVLAMDGFIYALSEQYGVITLGN